MNALKALWRQHGTKVLGFFTAAYSTITALLAVLSASPDVQFLLPHKWFAVIAVGNLLLGVLTAKRGFTNTRNASEPNQP